MSTRKKKSEKRDIRTPLKIRLVTHIKREIIIVGNTRTRTNDVRTRIPYLFCVIMMIFFSYPFPEPRALGTRRVVFSPFAYNWRRLLITILNVLLLLFFFFRAR